MQFRRGPEGILILFYALLLFGFAISIPLFWPYAGWSGRRFVLSYGSTGKDFSSSSDVFRLIDDFACAEAAIARFGGPFSILRWGIIDVIPEDVGVIFDVFITSGDGAFEQVFRFDACPGFFPEYGYGKDWAFEICELCMWNRSSSQPWIPELGFRLFATLKF